MGVRTVLVILLAAGFGGFGWLSVALLTGHVQLAGDQPGLSRLRGRLGSTHSRRLLAAIAGGLLVLVVTSWVAVAVAAGAMVLAWPKMFGAARQQQAVIGRLEALASWIEALRDTIANGLALPEAIPLTAANCPPVLQRPLQDLVARMQAREPLDRALLTLADDLNDPVADQAIAALALNAREQGKQLKAVLGALADATRKQVDVRRHVEADRGTLRQGVRIIMIVVVVVVVGLGMFNRTYVEPFSTVTGQLVLALAVACFAAGFAWMHRLSGFSTSARFLGAATPAGRSAPASIDLRDPAPTASAGAAGGRAVRGER